MKTQEQSVKPIGRPAILALNCLIPSGSNREVRKDTDLKGLASSIAEVGLIYPIVVKPDSDHDGQFRIVAGERRWRALRILKKESVPCVVLSAREDDSKTEVMRLVENHQRKNLEPLEEAAAVRALLDSGLEPAAVARSLGRSRAWVARRASLMDLSDEWVREIGNEESRVSTWPPSHLEIISRFPTETQNQILERWASDFRREIPALRDLSEMTGTFLRQLGSAPWRLDDETLAPEAGACSACPKRSSHVPDLFEDELSGGDGRPVAGDQCLDAQCWATKARVFLGRKCEEMRQEHPNLILLNNGNGASDIPEAATAPNVVQSWQAVACKKTEEGARPALVVSGPGLGRLRWVRLGSEESIRSARSKAAPSEVEGPPVEPTPEIKKQSYDKRRRQVVIEAVRGKLHTLAHVTDLAKVLDIEGGKALVGGRLVSKTLCLLSALLSDYGWNRRALEAEFHLPEGLAWEDCENEEGPSTHESEEPAARKDQDSAILAVCWNLLRMAVRVWAFRLDVTSGDRTNDLQYVESERVCSMLKFDLPALRAQAAETIPYAKAWTNAVTDDWATQSPTKASDAAETKTSAVEPADARSANGDYPRPKSDRGKRNAHEHTQAAAPEA